MALAIRNAAPLKPEIRLAQAVSEFEASLGDGHKEVFRTTRKAALRTAPIPSDVMRLTAEIDSRVRKQHGLSRCFGPRLTNILQAVQQFAALGDTVVGGSQNLVACGVWSAVRTTLYMAVNYASYLEKLSLLFMTAGRQAPRYQALATIYPQSETLQSCLSEYFIVVVHVCQKIQKYGNRSAFGQFKSSLNDADLKGYQADLEVWGNAIKDQATVLLNQVIHHESQENNKSRMLMSWWSASARRQQALERKMRWLDACSRYDFQTTWKQIRKRGSTSLLPTWPDYQQWKQEIESTSAILFSGKVGAGKSVTMANIVDDVYLVENAIVVYFFCRHDIQESLKSRIILGSLARQYLSYFPEDNGVFKEGVPSLDLDELTTLMKLKCDNRPRYLLLDGLDECSEEERRSVLLQLSFLQRHSSWRLGFSARLSTESFIQRHITLRRHISLPILNPDIERYIDNELENRLSSGQLTLGDPNLLFEIRNALLSGANGMFLWVALQLDQVCSEISDHAIRLAIKSLPRDLSETYARILGESSARDTGRHHVRLFKFLAAAYTPLTIDQIQEVASVTIGDATWDPSKRINNIRRVVGFCGSLVMIQEEEQTVQFVHHSARSFCQGVLEGFGRWKFCFSDDEAHREIGETAVTYLSYGIFDTRLSTQLMPKVKVDGFAQRIVQQTIGTSNPIVNLALDFVMPKTDSDRDIAHFLTHTHQRTSATEFESTNHPFLPYAREFWILHTRNIENSEVHRLWEQLFNEVDLSHLQLTPHVAGPLDHFKAPCKHPIASAFLWAVNYSHVAVFDRVMDLGRNHPFAPGLPWARFRFFRSLLQYLQPHGPFDKVPRLNRQMIRRLLPMAVVLRVYHAVEWMLPHVDPAQILSVFEVAISCGNYTSAAILSSNAAFSPPNKPIIPTELMLLAASTHDPRMIGLLAKMGAARSAHTNTSALSSLLHSDMHHGALLEATAILANAGLQPNTLNSRDKFAVFQLLALGPETSAKMALGSVESILAADSDFPRLHQQILQRACSIGSFDLANAVLASYDNFTTGERKVGISKVPHFPFEGNELVLILQMVSESRTKLASLLVNRGCHDKDRRGFRRALVLRHWQLADALLNGRDLTSDTLTLCDNHELLHLCLFQGDLIGINVLLKIGISFENPSTGPLFKHATPMQALLAQDSEYFIRLSMVELHIRGALSMDVPTKFSDLRTAVKRLLSPSSSSAWDPQIQQI
ncbi:hypothetical protein GCG54_00006365, partial [Colletotrichum gloeosporioides]